MTNSNAKVIFDTNVWISFLIGKRLKKLRKFITDNRITVITTDQLLTEIKIVTARKKLKKYFPEESVKELMELLEIIAERVQIKPTNFLNRDPKDSFLLDLIEYSKADYLVTGDKDLIEINKFKTAKILTVAEFERELSESENH
ncbi:MAG: putative toxin-antitoxin system toxin component, PIN family [Chitinophagaceae bacterium]|nr:putative toxin-antitoxin system toxin component, PIN family [Chitinophagaceae bacterium]